MTYDRITLLSPGGTYEFSTSDAHHYELVIPDEVNAAAVLVKDQRPGEPDNDANAPALRVFEAIIEVGKIGLLLLEKPSGKIESVRTGEVTVISKVD